MARPIDRLDRMRVVAGLCAAVQVPALLGLAVTAIGMYSSLSGRAEGALGTTSPWLLALGAMAASYLLGSLLASAVAFGFGLPVLLVARRLGWESRTAFALGGALLGWVSGWLFDLWSYHSDPEAQRLALDGVPIEPGPISALTVVGALCGLVSGLVFRAVVYREASPRKGG